MEVVIVICNEGPTGYGGDRSDEALEENEEKVE
jgi:hypothetical protein